MAVTTGKTRQGQPPVVIVLDRSRDLLAAERLLHLEPDDRYHVTDSRVPLRAAALRRYDVLVIAGQAPMSYTPAELAAIVQFVRRGGGLLLAASAGHFERYMSLPAKEMGTASVGRRFGIELLGPGRAAAGARPDVHLVKGYPHQSIRPCRWAASRGLRSQDIFLDQWSPVRSARPATVLLSHRRTGEAAALSVRFGRGRVVAVGGSSILRASHRLCRALFDYLAAGRPRRPPTSNLPWQILPRSRRKRFDNVELRYAPAAAGRVGLVERLARKILPRLEAWFAAKKRPGWRVELSGSCGWEIQWWPPPPVIRLGVDAPEAELAFALGAAAAEVVCWPAALGQHLRWTVLGREALGHFVGLAAMRLAGFGDLAERLGEQLEGESRRRFKGIDAGRFYSEGVTAPGLWIWRELQRRYGDDFLKRLFAAVPPKLDRPAAPWVVFTELDVVIHFLSRAAGTDLFGWFAELGSTVHPLPPARWGGQTFKEGVRRSLRRLLADPQAPASERAAALDALAADQGQAKRPLGRAARQLRSPDPAARLAAATRLLRAGDPRAPSALEQIAKSRKDKALSAVAALQLVGRGNPGPANRLAELAEHMDHRFQLDAGYRLARLGHRRAGRFSPAGIARRRGRGAVRLQTRYQGEVMVFPVVDGQPVANIFSGDVVGHMPGNTHISMFFVYWVHTDAKARRKGLSRLAMQRSLEDARARRCSCASLGTGTRNVAHAMYRSFGFVDAPPGRQLTCRLAKAPRPAARKGIRVRGYRRGDEAAMARLFNERYLQTGAVARRRPTALGQADLALLADRARRLTGYLVARTHDDGATIHDMAVAKDRRQHDTAAALVGRLHRDLAGRGVKQVTARGEFLAPLLQPLGYRGEETGGVGMIALLSLPQFLREISPLLERRLARAAWSGTVSLLGLKHRAALSIHAGRVAALPRPPRHADINLAGSDETITRIVAGIQTPFEAYLQLDLKIAPALTEKTTQLLETLFPRLEMFQWMS